MLNSLPGTPASEARTPDLLNTVLLPAILINNIFRLNLISQPELKGWLAAGWRPRVRVSMNPCFRPTRLARLSFCLAAKPTGLGTETQACAFLHRSSEAFQAPGTGRVPTRGRQLKTPTLYAAVSFLAAGHRVCFIRQVYNLQIF